VTLAPGQPRTLEILLRANGAPANLRWTATPAGNFVPIVSPTQGTVSLAANQMVAVPLTVTVPSGVTGSDQTGFISLRVYYDPGNGVAVPLQTAQISAAVQGRPQLYPSPSTSTMPAGTPGSVTYQLRSTIAAAESFHVSVGRQNTDENNPGRVFPYFAPTTPILLPGMGTLQITVPIYPPGNAYPGNFNSFQVGVSSNDVDDKVSDSRGHAFISSPDVDSLPTTFHPVGLVPQEQTAAGRDGPAPIPNRNLWLVPSGGFGVRVLHDSALGQVGKIDRDVDGADDRLVGRIRLPAASFAAAAAVVPGYVNSAMETFDLGLLAAGNSGLMLLNLSDVYEPRIGSWEDWYDLDANGIDDRILRMIPMAGFATDVEWFRTPEGRLVALVASADVGSVPVSAGYDPALAAAGTGAGVVAVDVGAALDSLPGVPFMAGIQATPGNALDLEVRGGSAPDLAVADGAGGVAFFGVSASGSPAVVSFASEGTVALNTTWGAPHARDLAWVANSVDSLYLAVAGMAGGVQVVRATPGNPPFLALAQRCDDMAIGLATTPTGIVAAALGSGGATMLKLPSRGEMDKISPSGSPPYQAPVVLGVGVNWTEGRPLKAGYFGAINSSITSMRFKPATPGPIPDLLCADGVRTLVIRPGASAVVGVGDPTPRPTSGVRLLVSPNPAHDRAELRVYGSGTAGTEAAPTEFVILDLQGRLVRKLEAPPAAGAAPLLARAFWDGRDHSGIMASPGRYWVVASRRGAWLARSALVLVR
jgi:hypothetical protein